MSIVNCDGSKGGILRFNTRDLGFTFFVFLVLCAPLRGFYLYYMVVSLLVIGFSIKTVPSLVNRFTIPFLLLSAFLLFAALLRTVIIGRENVRDYIEVARFVPIVLLYASIYKWREMRVERILDAAFLYLCIDIGVSWMQFVGVDVLGISRLIQLLYSSELHAGVLGLTHRALGLSPGPGQHGAILFTLAVAMLFGGFTASRRRWIYLSGFVMALMGILLSQSQTAFVVTIAIVLGMLGAFLLSRDARHRRNAAIILCLFAVSSVYVFTLIATRFRYLFTLFAYGLGRTSYTAREDKWDIFLSKSLEHPWWFPFGWGKAYFGSASGAMDSDLLYIFCVYGGLVSIVFATVLFVFFFGSLRDLLIRRRVDDLRFLLFALLLGGVVFSWPNAFFIVPNIMVLISLFHACWWWDRVRKSRGHRMPMIVAEM